MRHFLYFPKKSNAEAAVEKLSKLGFAVEVRKHPDGEAWVVEATNKPPTSAEKMDEIRDEMEVLAAQFGGDYDGWEVAVNSLRDAGGRKIH